MYSAIYEGRIRHARFSPTKHDFSYRICMLYIDLDEIDDVFGRSPFWSAGKWPAPASFRREDYLRPVDVTLREAVSTVLLERTGKPLTGPLRLLTHPRYWGFCFNPVTFYYCFDALGQEVEAIVAEVHNTPWDERFVYVVESALESGSEQEFRLRKEFHVSPFMAMDLDYHWFFSFPEDRLRVVMEDRRGEEKVFRASLDLHRREIGGRTLAAALIKYPFMTLKVLGGIYWQAFRLWRKKTPYCPHPKSLSADSGEV